MTPKSNDTCPHKRQEKRDAQRERGRPCEDRGRDWKKAAVVNEHPEPLEARGWILPLSLWRDRSPLTPRF